MTVNCLGELQTKIEEKLLKGILEEKGPSRRRLLVDEYEGFKRAISMPRPLILD